MNIVPKLTLAIVTGMCVVLAANGYLRVRREVRMFEDDRKRDHEMVARSLSAAVTSVWRSEGEAPAMATIADVSKRFSQIRVRWIPDGHDDEVHLSKDEVTSVRARAGEPITTVVGGAGAKSRWYTYVPLAISGDSKGFLELDEPAPVERHFARTVVIDTVSTFFGLTLLSALLSFALGQWLVGRPVRILSDAARRIGRGELGESVVFERGDEFGFLAGEINAMSRQLVSTLEQLRHADRLTTVGKLASGVAHELGTPLNVISARAGMIAKGETTPEESREYARVVVEASERMTKIIRQLLQFARRKGPQRGAADVRALTREVLDLLAPLAAKRGLELHLADGEKAVASVEAGQLQQAITNLVMNAIQATPVSGARIELALLDERAIPPADVGGGARACVCLRVRDAGGGIAEDVLPHVFEPFFTTKDVGEGTGLGLAVTYGIIKDHGGWIAVESQVGKGSVFDVFLPREPQAEGA